MFTRQDYFNRKCDHDTYYGQMVTEGTISRVVSWIGRDKILNSRDPHFNDIPLSLWDALVPGLPGSGKFSELGDIYTKSGGVCLAKAAARIFKNRSSSPLMM